MSTHYTEEWLADRLAKQETDQPLAIDLYCGLGGWTEGLLAEGYRVVGFDIERHEYGDHKYPAQLVIQDVLTLHGSQFKDAALIVCSPPCQEFSYMAMPWTLAKEKQRLIESDPAEQKRLTALFDACFRIQREACEAAGKHIPLVVENVRGAQKWVGRAGWHFGSFYLWGDIPALMPIVTQRRMKFPAPCGPRLWSEREYVRLNDGNASAFHHEKATKANEGTKVSMPPGGDSLTIGFQQMAKLQAAEGFKTAGMNWSDRTKTGQDFTRIAGSQATKNNGGSWFNIGSPGQKEVNRNPVHEAVKNGGDWFNSKEPSAQRQCGSKSNARKAASAMIAKIPFVLSSWIARAWKPEIPK